MIHNSIPAKHRNEIKSLLKSNCRTGKAIFIKCQYRNCWDYKINKGSYNQTLKCMFCLLLCSITLWPSSDEQKRLGWKTFAAAVPLQTAGGVG